jgi:hypothetical protein
VNPSIWLLTAVLAANGPADGQPCAACQANQQQQVIYSDSQQVIEQPQRTGLFPALRARLENWRHRDQASMAPAPQQQVIYAQPSNPQQGYAQQGYAQPVYVQQNGQTVLVQPVQMQQTQVMYARPMPIPTNAEPPQAPAVVQASSQNASVPEVAKEFKNKIGAADDYSWITGQLFYVHVDGGTWVLRYGAVGQEDKYGGSVVLACAADMKNYREGDLVSVTGEILGDARASQHLGGPKYRVDGISMIERVDK